MLSRLVAVPLIGAAMLQACSAPRPREDTPTPECIPKADVSLAGDLRASFQPLAPYTYPVSEAYVIVLEAPDQATRVSIFLPSGTPPGTYQIQDSFAVSQPDFSARLGVFGDASNYFESTEGTLVIDQAKPCLAGSFSLTVRDHPEEGPAVDIRGTFAGITDRY